MPRDTSEIDDEISDIQKQLRDSRIVFWLCVAGIIIGSATEAFLIHRSIVFTGPDGQDGWGIAAVVLGFGLAIGGSLLIALGHDSRESIFAARQSLARALEYRRGILSGTGNSRISVLNRYKNDLPEIVEGYRVTARRYRSRHNIIQAVVVLGSLGASAVIGVLGETYTGRVVGATVSAVVAIAAAFSAYFRYKEKSLSLQAAADGIEQQHRAVQLGIGGYAGKSAIEALSQFAETVEGIRSNQQRQALELDQAVRVEYQAGPSYDLSQ